MTYKELINSIIAAAEPIYGAREAAAIARLVAEKRYGLTRADLALTPHAELPPPRRLARPTTMNSCVAIPDGEKNIYHRDERRIFGDTNSLHAERNTALDEGIAASDRGDAAGDGEDAAGDRKMAVKSGNSAADEADFSRLIADLAAARPVQYILGVADFDGMELTVGEGVLIPRPETEELVEWIANDAAERCPTGVGVAETELAAGYLGPGPGGVLESASAGFVAWPSERFEAGAAGGGKVGTAGLFGAEAAGRFDPKSEHPDSGPGGRLDPKSERHDPGRFTILDIGTGSGAIAIALAKRLPEARVEAIDVSPEALSYARLNNERTGAGIVLIQADIFDPALDSALDSALDPALDPTLDSAHDPALNSVPRPTLEVSDGSLSNSMLGITGGLSSGPAHSLPQGAKLYDVIVSNPPYIPDTERDAMPANVTGHEPAQALFVPADDHLVFYRAIAKFAFRRLAPGGALYFEIFEKAAREVIELIEAEGFSKIEMRKDINSKPRMIKCLI